MITAEFTNEINDLITENLYQWDTYQTLKISGIDFGSVTPRVHFANKKSTEALVVNAVLKDDGSVEASIPNTLLAEKYDILAYIYINTGLTNKTIKSITIPIIPRLKPSEYYQPSNEDIAQIEAIELEAKALIDGFYADTYSSTNSYKRPNLVRYRNSMYMCISPNEITNVPPNNPVHWRLIIGGITGISVGSDSKLKFNFGDGTSYSIDFLTEDTELMDETDIPALKLTNEDIIKIQTPNGAKDIQIKRPDEQTITGLPRESVDISKPGLYALVLKTGGDKDEDGLIKLTTNDTSTYYMQTVMFNIVDLNYDMQAYYMGNPTSDAVTKAFYVTEYKASYGDIHVTPTSSRIMSAKLIMEY